MINLPSTDEQENAAALARGLLQLIPAVGGLLSEGLNSLANPIEARKRRWTEEVTSAVNELNERFSLLPEDLANDERFVSFLLQATSIAMRNHQVEKLRALRAAIVSAADTKSFSEDESFALLRYVDDLTPSHLALLSHLSKNIDSIASMHTMENIYSYVSAQMAGLSRTMFRSWLRDLDRYSLIGIEDVEDYEEYATMRVTRVTEASKQRPLVVTASGERFLTFISQAH